MFTPIFLLFFLQPRADAAPDVGDADDWQLHSNSAFITAWRTLQIPLLCSGEEQSLPNCSLDFFLFCFMCDSVDTSKRISYLHPTRGYDTLLQFICKYRKQITAA